MNKLLGMIFQYWGYILVKTGMLLIGLAMHPFYNLFSFFLVAAVLCIIMLA